MLVLLHWLMTDSKYQGWNTVKKVSLANAATPFLGATWVELGRGQVTN